MFSILSKINFSYLITFKVFCCLPNVFGDILESACLSVHLCVRPCYLCVQLCVQNSKICQRAGGGIKSHLLTALVSIWTSVKFCRLESILNQRYRYVRSDSLVLSRLGFIREKDKCSLKSI